MWSFNGALQFNFVWYFPVFPQETFENVVLKYLLEGLQRLRLGNQSLNDMNVHVLLTYTNFSNHIQMYIFKVTRPNSTTYLNETPIFEWCVSRRGTKNKQPINTCLQKVEDVVLSCQTIQDSTINVIGRTYTIAREKIICHLSSEDDNQMSSQYFSREMGLICISWNWRLKLLIWFTFS